MQINGAHLSTAFALKPNEHEEKSRSPIVIDVAPEFQLPENEQAIKVATYIPPTTAIDEQQQARFVRLFSFSSGQLTQAEDNNQQIPRTLPHGVQQYLQIATLGSDDNQRLFDETV